MSNPESRNIRIEIAYDGSRYFGWQKQVNAPTVQGEMEKALHLVFQSVIPLSGIGRTDSGAHAFKYTAHFHTVNRTLPTPKIPTALNSVLPSDIRVLTASEADPEYHSRFSALAREYVYFYVAGTQPLPHLYNYTEYRDASLDGKLLQEACRRFVGIHNFRSFCSGYGESMNFVRKIFRFRVKKIEAGTRGISSFIRKGSALYVFTIKGNGFLKGMIRTIISACISCAEGKIGPDALSKALEGDELLDSKYRSPVSANGLWFKRGYF